MYFGFSSSPFPGPVPPPPETFMPKHHCALQCALEYNKLILRPFCKSQRKVAWQLVYRQSAPYLRGSPLLLPENKHHLATTFISLMSATTTHEADIKDLLFKSFKQAHFLHDLISLGAVAIERENNKLPNAFWRS